MNIKKPLAVAVILLFFSVSVIPSTGITDVKQITIPMSSGNTLYVGGDGPGNYTRIQDAINDSDNGDTVYVYDDSSPYYENIVVDKSITLQGENKETTVINGSGIDSVIEVSTDHVHIEGFTVTNCMDDSSEAGINIFTDWNTIRNNNIVENQCMGIRLSGSLYNLIENNTLKDNRGYHISLRESNNNTVQNNTLTQSDNWLHECIGIWLSHSSDNLIENNEITGTRTGVGIFLDSISSYNIMIHDYLENIILDNIISGWCWYGIGLSYSCNNIIIDNKILDSVMGIDLSYSSNNIITGNSISSVIGILFFHHPSNNNNITGNNISNGLIGIWLHSSKNIIEKNNFIGNKIAHANFYISWRNIVGTYWDSNYWDNWIGFGPKIIFGRLGPIPWVNFDWHPTLIPYDIGV